jgi:NAD-dependent deacetylase
MVRIDLIRQAAKEILNRGKVVALTGAGISVDSGIPDFRSPGGLWSRFDPMEYAHIEAFRSNPVKVWNMLLELRRMVAVAKPNPGHCGLMELEQLGFLEAIITQNVDHLHQEAGNKDVIEFHGSVQYLVCLSCGSRYVHESFTEKDLPPRCRCDSILKPDVVFFGESIPLEAQYRAQKVASSCNIMMVIGTSAVVYPAAEIPYVAKRNGATIIEINMQESSLTRSITHIHLEGSSSIILPLLVKEVRSLSVA